MKAAAIVEHAPNKQTNKWQQKNPALESAIKFADRMIISQPILPHFPVKEFVEIIKLVDVTLRKKRKKETDWVKWPCDWINCLL